MIPDRWFGGVSGGGLFRERKKRVLPEEYALEAD
jgi:hypothetical protein